MTTPGFLKMVPRLGAVVLGALLFTAGCGDENTTGTGGLTPDEVGPDTIIRRYPPGSPMCRAGGRELLDEYRTAVMICGTCTIVMCGDDIVLDECAPDCGQDPPEQNP